MALPVTDKQPTHSKSPELQVISSVTARVQDQSAERLRSQLQFALFAVGNVLLFELLLLVPYFGEVETGLRQFFVFLSVALLLGVFVFSLGDFFLRAWDHLSRGRVSWETNIATALVIGLVSSIVSPLLEASSAFVLKIPATVLALSFLIVAWRSLHNFIARRLNESYHLALDKLPREVALRGSQNEVGEQSEAERKPLAEIESGDRFVIEAGGYIPCDGTIVKGHCELRERLYGGKDITRIKGVGGEVFAGSKLISGQIEIEAAYGVEDSRLMTFWGALQERLTLLDGEDRKIERVLTLAHLLILFLSACAGMYWYDKQAALPDISYVIISTLSISLLVSFLVYLPHLKRLLLSAIYQRGALLRDPNVLRKLEGVKSLVIDWNENAPLGESRVTRFDLVDERIDSDGLISALLVLFGQSEEEVHIAAAEYLHPKVKDLQLFNVKDFQSVPSYGLCGNVEGVEFSVGREGYLIERGVHIQASDLEEPEDSSEWHYIAIGVEVVARILIRQPLLEDGADLVKRLRDLNIRPALCSEHGTDEDMDQIGKSLGLVLAEIHSELGDTGYQQKLEELSDPALFATVQTNPELFARSRVSFCVFDLLQWNLGKQDVTLFGRSSLIPAAVFELSKRYFLVRKVSSSVVIGLSVLLLALSALGKITPLITCVSIFAATLALSLMAGRLLPKLD